MNDQQPPLVGPTTTPQGYQPPPRESQQPAPGYPQAPPSAWHASMSEIGARGLADPRRKHPLLAIVLSAMPGLGQIYVGYYRQGITVAAIAGALLTVAVQTRLFGLIAFEPLLVMATWFTWLYGCVDAGRKASLYNQALSGLRPMDLPENQRTPEWHGSVVGGACLAGFGIVLFLHTMFDVPMEWIARWWPLALVLVGVWLVYASVRSRPTDAPPPHPSADLDA